MQAPFADPLSGLDLLNKTLPLVGRESEMQVVGYLLHNVLLDVPTGARALTISGEMGVGKSRLLAELFSAASVLGFRVLESRAYEAVSMFPYFPFIDALRPLIRTSPEEKLRSYLGFSTAPESGPDQDIALSGMPLLSALARLFPELPGSLGITVTAEPLSPEQEKFRLLDAVATLLERAAREQPIVLGIDNLQWADSASLELTMYLTVRLHRSRVALVGVTRPPAAAREQWAQDDQTGTPAASLAAARALAGLVSQGLLLPLPLAPLAPDAAAAYLHMLLPGALPPEVEQALLERSEGNPFFLEELVRALTLNRQLLLRGNTWQATKLPLAELPGSLILAVQQRLQGLSSACREVLRVAALFGRSFPLEALLHVFQRAENAADIPALLDEAARAEIIALAPAPAIGQDEADFAAFNDHAVQLSTYLFCQGIVQEVLDAEVPRHRLSGLHNAIGAALETLDAYTTPAHAAMLARHYTSGGNKSAALRWNLLAGEYAASQQAHREAIRHFRLALGFIEGGEVSAQAPSLAQVYVTIGELWFRLAEFEQAAPAFQKALELLAAQQQNEPGQETELQFARANRLMADVYRMQAKYDQAWRISRWQATPSRSIRRRLPRTVLLNREQRSGGFPVAAWAAEEVR